MEQTAQMPRLNEEALIFEKPKRSIWNRLGREEVIFLLFIFPNIGLFAIFTFWPMARAFYLSGVRWDMISPTKRWVGLANYEYLFNSEAFRKTLIASLYYTVGTIGGTLILAVSW